MGIKHQYIAQRKKNLFIGKNEGCGGLGVPGRYRAAIGKITRVKLQMRRRLTRTERHHLTLLPQWDSSFSLIIKRNPNA